VPEAVETDLGHQQRSITCEVLQPGEIRVEPLLGLEVDVEAHEVEERQLEIFRRRVVHIGDERTRVARPHVLRQALDVTLHLSTAEPAHGGRRNLVPHGIPEHGGMAHAAPQPRHQPFVGAPAAAVVQISHETLGTETYEYA
jgi:hypothetical protein